MQKISDLDRKTKYATMKTQSSIFSQTVQPSNSNGMLGARKGGVHLGRKPSIGGIMTHIEGPLSNIEWSSKSKKSMIADKVSQQDSKMMKRETFIRVMSYKKEQPIRTKANANKAS